MKRRTLPKTERKPSQKSKLHKKLHKKEKALPEKKAYLIKAESKEELLKALREALGLPQEEQEVTLAENDKAEKPQPEEAE